MMSLLPFWGLKVVVALLSMELSDLIKNIFIFVPKMNKSLMGLV